MNVRLLFNDVTEIIYMAKGRFKTSSVRVLLCAKLIFHC